MLRWLVEGRVAAEAPMRKNVWGQGLREKRGKCDASCFGMRARERAGGQGQTCRDHSLLAECVIYDAVCIYQWPPHLGGPPACTP